MIRCLVALALAAGLQAGTPEFAERAKAIVEYNASPGANGPLGYSAIAARLKLHRTPEVCSDSLERLLDAGPSGDMFWMFPAIAIAYLDQEQLTSAARGKLRDAWRTYMPYRGDTENHWLMYYTSLYLAAQLWPDEEGDRWYTGKSSRENFEEARGWIEKWVKLTTTRGQGEYDSPHYMGVYLIPMSYLAAWAKDPAMKQRATMMLDYLIADYAPENVDGIYVGAQSRVYDAAVLDKASNVASDFGWLWFGLGKALPRFDAYSSWYTYASAYEPPEVLRRIATDRSEPYTHYERKRTRNRWRFEDEFHGPVYKTTYMRREYAVSSDQGGVLQPIQQHSWDVTWRVTDALGKHNTLFTLNPHSSIHELQTFFTFARDTGIPVVVSSKKLYDSPEKLVGGSPYERIFQDEDTVIALYDIAPGARFGHVNGFFSKDLEEVVEDPSGWIFARGGEARIAFRMLRPYSWAKMAEGDRRMFSPYARNGVVVQVATTGEYPEAGQFRKAILGLLLQFDVEKSPEVTFRSLRGKTLHFAYNAPPDRSGWPLFGGKFVRADVDGERLTIQHGTLKRVLDFRALTVTDEQ